jgi:hypothetical protein
MTQLLEILSKFPWEELAHVTTTLALFVTLIIFTFERRTQNRLLRIQYLVQAQDKYDSICAIRSQNPDFILIGHTWSPKRFEVMTEREISYYHYIEMTLGFIETYVYLTFVSKTVPRKMFFEFIEPMIWLEVSYNVAAFEHFAKARSISPRACAFLQFVTSEIKNKQQTAPLDPGFNIRLAKDLESRYDFSPELKVSRHVRSSKFVLARSVDLIRRTFRYLKDSGDHLVKKRRSGKDSDVRKSRESDQPQKPNGQPKLPGAQDEIR